MTWEQGFFLGVVTMAALEAIDRLIKRARRDDWLRDQRWERDDG